MPRIVIQTPAQGSSTLRDRTTLIAGAVRIINSDESFDQTVSTADSPITLNDTPVQVLDENSQPLGTGNVPSVSGGSVQVTTPAKNVRVKNSDLSFDQTYSSANSPATLANITITLKDSAGTVMDTAIIPSAVSKDVEVPDVTYTDSDGSPITQAAALPIVCTLPTPKNTAMLIKTGQTISSFLHDDGYYQIGRPTSALVLSQLNPVGTYARFYLIPSTNIVCDFSLVDAQTGQFMMYDKSDVTTGRAIAAHGLYGATKSVAGKTGWMPVNRRMLEWIRLDGQTWAWNNSPFNFNGSGIGDYLTTNTIVHSSAGTQIWMHYNYNGSVYSQARGVTESLPTMFCRVGNISEL